MLKKIKDNFLEYLIIAILFGGLFYASTTAWKNEEKLSVLGSDVKSIKRSMISILFDKNPNKSEIAKDLVADAKLFKGIESFKAGDYRAAYTTWSVSAYEGNRDSVYAIVVANDVLKNKIDNPKISDKERERIIKILESAPKIQEKSGIYYISNKKKKTK